MTPDIAAEAAVWVARLHGPSRSPRMDRDCRAWQARSAAHREAFERCTETWQDVPRVTVTNAYASARTAADADSAARSSRLRWAPALALAAAVLGGGAVLWQWTQGRTYDTRVGEQQRILLDDGSRVTLNTDTRLTVKLEEAERDVELLQGEALFEVAKDAHRPFVVRAGGVAVVAHGTAFSVRLNRQGSAAARSLSVTLLEGSVSVQAAAGGETTTLAPSRPQQLQPGERLRLSASSGGHLPVARVDRPNLDSVTAWQRSEAVFDDTSLADAVIEMNRYSRTPIVLFDPVALGSLRVSGLYRTGNSEGFARAVAALHGLVLREQAGRLELAKPQSGNR